MVASFVQVNPFSVPGGAKMQTFANLIGADTVEAEAVVLVNGLGVEISPATEPTLLGIAAALALSLDVPLSSRASEATLVTRASEASSLAILGQLDVALSTRASEATLAAGLDVPLSSRASEATLSSIGGLLVLSLDTTLSSRASEATLSGVLGQLDVALSTRASEATSLAILGQLDVALSTRASEATLATRASEATLAAGLDVALSTRASEATLATRASEATLATRASEATSLAILAQLDVALSTRASQATLLNVLTTAAFEARINTLGQKTAALSTPVVLPSDQDILGKAKAEASMATMTLVADGATTDTYADLDGALITKPLCPFGDILTEAVSNTDGVSTALATFGATASARNMVTTISVINTSNTNGYIDFRDGAAGSVFFRLPIPRDGGAVISFPVPLRQPTANTALAYDVSAALTTVYISVVGFKSKV